jgi:hypothetical protein
VRTLAIALTMLAVAVSAAAAKDAPPRFVAVDLKVHPSLHRADLTTIVEDDPSQVLDRDYRTTLYYRCGSSRTWLVAVRSRRTSASVTLRWRYTSAMHGRHCSFRVKVVRLDSGLHATSAIIRRTL